MAFSVKDWKDDPDHTTPLTAAAIEDLETRLSTYTDDQDAATVIFLSSSISAKVGNSIIDAKGDIFAGTANDTPDNLPAGSNDTVLIADSAQTMGLKYAKVANAQVDTAAAIAYSKLNLATSIVAGDIAAALKPSGSAAAGTESLRALGTSSSTAAAGDHTHSKTMSAPIFLRYLSGTGVPAERATSLLAYNNMGDAANHIWSGNIMVPPIATAGQAMTIRVFVTSGTTGNVRWELKSQLIADTGGTSSAPTAYNATSTITANQMRSTDITIGNATANSLLQVRLLRLGNDALDTLAANAEVLHAELVYTATI
jgi:hypothetical protein